MKKLFFTFLLLTAFSGSIQAQTSRPNMNVIIRGDYSVWLSDSSWKNTYKAFPGFQIEAVVNLNSNWGITGTFGADFVSPKEKSLSIPGATFTQANSTQISGYLGPRYYINIPSNKNLRIYLDAAAGLYSFKPGELKITETTNPPTISTTTFSTVSQFGFNIGAGLNVNMSRQAFINFMVKYHNVLKKNNVVLKEKTTVKQGSTTISESSSLPPENVPGRGFFQFGLGIGFTFGL